MPLQKSTVRAIAFLFFRCIGPVTCPPSGRCSGFARHLRFRPQFGHQQVPFCPVSCAGLMDRVCSSYLETRIRRMRDMEQCVQMVDFSLWPPDLGAVIGRGQKASVSCS